MGVDQINSTHLHKVSWKQVVPWSHSLYTLISFSFLINYFGQAIACFGFNPMVSCPSKMILTKTLISYKCWWWSYLISLPSKWFVAILLKTFPCRSCSLHKEVSFIYLKLTHSFSTKHPLLLVLQIISKIGFHSLFSQRNNEGVEHHQERK